MPALTVKPHTEALRRRLAKMRVPSALVLRSPDFIPTARWFSHQSAQLGMYFSVRRFEGDLFVFRLK